MEDLNLLASLSIWCVCVASLSCEDLQAGPFIGATYKLLANGACLLTTLPL